MVPPKDQLTFDIAIVGLGPVGATLANILGQYELSTIILERDPATYHLPRAVAFDDEVMRIFQSIELANQINEIVEVGAGAHFVDKNGKVLVNWARPQEVGPNGWFLNYRFHQPELEKILRKGLSRFPSVKTLLHREVCSITEYENGVDVEYKNLKTGKLNNIRAGFVIGCDGANSFTRNRIGRGFEDLGFHEPWLVVDVILKKHMPDLGPQSVHHCNPNRSATYVFLAGNRRRWEFRLKPEDDPIEISRPEKVWSMLNQWIGPDDATLERAIVYTFHSSIAEQWLRGRLLIAGDAAHQTPPFMGQGMCAGIRDVFNLGWKLDSVFKGRASEDLLDTYELERKPHVRAFIDLTVKMGHLINTTASSLISGIVSTGADEPPKLSQLRPTLGIGLSACRTDWTGQLFPQPRLQSGKLLDDLVGRRFAILMRREFLQQLPHKIKLKMEKLDIIAINDPATGIQGWCNNKDINAVLIRPDRYILGGAKTLEEVGALIKAY